VLAAIAPVIRPKVSGWAGVLADLDRMTALVDAQHGRNGWTAPDALGAPTGSGWTARWASCSNGCPDRRGGRSAEDVVTGAESPDATGG